MELRDIHGFLAWVVVLVNAAAGVLALAAHWVEAIRGRWLWVFVGLAQVLIGVQVILGVAAMQSTEAEVNGVHLFYGFVALFTVGIIYSYAHQIERWRYLLYGFGGLFLMGLALRSIYIPPFG